MVPISNYITTVVTSLLTAVTLHCTALSFEMNKSQTQEIFWTFLQLLDLLGLLQMEMTNFPAFLYTATSEIRTRSYA